MDKREGWITRLGKMLDDYWAERREAEPEPAPLKRAGWLRQQMAPNLGTILVVIVLLLTVPALAAPMRKPLQQTNSTNTISYQGRLADSGGNPLTGKYNLEFRIYDVPTGGTPLWTEMWTGANSVDVSDGLFNVMLGSINNTLTTAIQGRNRLYLGITVNADSEMVPRVQLGSVPFSMQALTVPDGSITTAKIEDGAVTQAKLGSDVNLHPPAQLYQATHDWSWTTTTASTWTRVGNLSVTFTVTQESLLVMTANGHVESTDPASNWNMVASFFVDGNAPLPSGQTVPFGAWYNCEDNTPGTWFPWSFTQLIVVGPGVHTVEVKTWIGGGTWTINGSAIQVAVLPR